MATSSKGAKSSKYTGKKGKSRGGSNRPFRDKDSRVYDKTVSSTQCEGIASENDPAWYAANPQLLKDYASYPFGLALGTTSTQMDTEYTSAIPGILTFEYYPSVGVTKQETDPINVAMRKLYSYVRHANSGAKNYEAPDLMMYIVAVDSANMYLEFMKRVYGVMMNYTAFNRYYPGAIVRAMNVDFNDVQANLANFRGYINQFAVKLNQLWVPSGFSYLKRHAWMTSHIYVDSALSAKAQTYMYTPVGFYQYAVAGDPAVGQLTMKEFKQTKPRTVSEIITFGDELLNALITNEDIGIMSGDILKAYGANNVMNVMGIAEDYRVFPEYSQEVMSQFENLRVISINPNSFNVTQDISIGGGFLVSKPKAYIRVKYSGTTPVIPEQYRVNYGDNVVAPYTGGCMLNLHNMDSSPESVIVASRGMFTIDESTIVVDAASPNVTVDFSAIGSDIVTCAKVSAFASATANPWELITSESSILGTNYADIAEDIGYKIRDYYCFLSQFDWHPDLQPQFITGEPADYVFSKRYMPFMDVDNYTFVDRGNIANMHALALLSMFTVPMVG